MKTAKFTFLYLCFCLLGITSFCQAQQPDASENYWVIETNAAQRKYSIVRFYDTAHQVIYEERLEGIHLDATRRRTKKLLNKTLHQVTNKALVAGQLKKIRLSPATATLAVKD